MIKRAVIEGALHVLTAPYEELGTSPCCCSALPCRRSSRLTHRGPTGLALAAHTRVPGQTIVVTTAAVLRVDVQVGTLGSTLGLGSGAVENARTVDALVVRRAICSIAASRARAEAALLAGRTRLVASAAVFGIRFEVKTCVCTACFVLEARPATRLACAAAATSHRTTANVAADATITRDATHAARP